MTLRDVLEHRRKELITFFDWRFPGRSWSGPVSFITGLPRWLTRKLRCRPLEVASFTGRPKNSLTIRDLMRLEYAAIALGFRPTMPGKANPAFLKPPPTNLPPASDPSVHIRFKSWQSRNLRDPKPKAKRERKSAPSEGTRNEEKIPPAPAQNEPNVAQSVAQTVLGTPLSRGRK